MASEENSGKCSQVEVEIKEQEVSKATNLIRNNKKVTIHKFVLINSCL